MNTSNDCLAHVAYDAVDYCTHTTVPSASVACCCSDAGWYHPIGGCGLMPSHPRNRCVCGGLVVVNHIAPCVSFVISTPQSSKPIGITVPSKACFPYGGGVIYAGSPQGADAALYEQIVTSDAARCVGSRVSSCFALQLMNNVITPYQRWFLIYCI
jgi:hypothetical protein